MSGKEKSTSNSEKEIVKKAPKDSKNSKDVDVEDVYKGMTLHQHILAAPDTYIGTTSVDELRMFIYNEETEKIVEDVINYIAGFFKIFDEILVNARDHTVRDKTCKKIEITIDKKTGKISVWNDGFGIPVVIHKKFGTYVPEMIFGNLLTSQNYGIKGKTVGGKNGYGGKLCLKKGTLLPTFNGEIKKIEDIEKGEKLIGDDGTSRNVLDIRTGTGELFEITQQGYDGESYVVNEDHILCLRMPDHKVIFWSSTEESWVMLWLDKQNVAIKKKSIRVNPKEKLVCQECDQELSSNLKRHYTRMHPDAKVPTKTRKSPTIIAPDTEEVKKGYADMVEFAKNIPDDNALDISVKDYMKLNETMKTRLSGYVGKCVQWESQDVEIDPYVLGLWLGDGYQTGNRFAINAEDDPEILKYLEEWGKKNDVKFKQTEVSNRIAYSISSLSKSGKAPLKKLLAKYNLVNNKHIPNEYLLNSRDVRLKLLAGFIDSDGHISREGTRIQIVQGMNHEKLAYDLIFLARSLGLMCCWRKINTQWKYEGELRHGEAISINISGEDAKDIPTRVARKKCNSPQVRDTTGTGKLTITQVDSGDFVGLAVDGNQRFVLSNFTVTHNCNIYSKEFEVHTIGTEKMKEVNGQILPDENSKKVEYKQVFRNNMYDIGQPDINPKISQASKTFTKITFLPDYEKFGMTGLTNDMYSLLVKRCYDIAACTSKNISISVNGDEIKCRKFEDYIRLYYGDETEEKPKITYEKVNSRWEVGIGFNKNVGDRSISFVNGISTFQGGTHVAHVVNNVVKKVTEYIKKKKEYKDLKIMPATIKQYLTFFINCVIEDPGFNSQTKEFMNSKMDNWCTCGKNCQDVKCELSDDFIKRLCDNGLMTEVVETSRFKEMRDLDKTDGKKVGSLRDIKKLIDAEWAGKRKSHLTNLFLTEGDSAKAFAVAGISVIGNERYGVYPLRGKLLNVRNATTKQIKENKEFCELKRIMGLKQGMRYKDVSKLRYGSIIILTDQDPDGSHIKGLIINMLEYFWPDLLQIDGFIKAYNTPIVKAWKTSDKKRANIKQFYSLTEYEDWKKNLGSDSNKWEHKYYKGLGTSTDKEARESFNDFDDNIVTFYWEDGNDGNDDNGNNGNNDNNLESVKAINKMKLALEKSESKKSKSKKEIEKEKENDKNENDKDSEVDEDERSEDKASKSDKTDKASEADADESGNNDYAYMKSKSHLSITKVFDESRVIVRKEWLQNFRRDNRLEYKANMKVSFTDFFDKDMIHFSHMDNDRSIPAMTDGLKPSQRMIMFSVFKRGRKAKEIKVAQLSGYVSENTDYHHGEASLQGAIIGLARNYPGSNNINLLKPNGNFGYRRQGGEDHASPRYIFTEMDPVTGYIFREEDEEILDYNYDDERKVEPETYAPIIPMILVNGGKGVGTGWSLTCPPHNPKDIVANLKRMLNDQEPLEMIPWWNGFKGTIEKNPKSSSKYIIKGKYYIDGNKVHVQDIPIVNGWIEPYEDEMEKRVSVSKDDSNKLEEIKKVPGNNTINMTLVFKGQELQKMIKNDTLDKYLMMTQNMSVTNLNLFNAEGRMMKYDTILDVLRDFYEYRLGMYQKRKDYQMKKLSNDLDLHKYKVKFIKEYLDGTLMIARKKVSEVIQQLEDKKYPRLANDHRVDDSKKSFRYLTDMSILTLTQDKIDELESDMQICQIEYEKYEKTPVKQIWLQELDQFLTAYDKWCKEWEIENAIADKGENDKKKKKRKQSKDAASDNASDNSDDNDKTSKTTKSTKSTKSIKAKPKSSDKDSEKKVVVKKINKKE